MSPRVTFYDMPFAARLALITKLAAAAWDRHRTMLIIAADPAMASEVDAFLWDFQPDAFIPHEIWRGPGALRDADARILIACPEDQPSAVPGRDVIVLLAPIDISFAAEFVAVVEVVAREDQAATELSRERFRAWRARGVRPEHKTTGD